VSWEFSNSTPEGYMVSKYQEDFQQKHYLK